VAFFQAVARPKFRGPRSASIARSQVWLGLPTGRFQSGGTCRIRAARAQWWSSRGELRAMAEVPQTSISHQVRERCIRCGEYTISSRSSVLPTCQMDRGERAGTLWWPKSRTPTSKLAQCMSDRGVTWFSLMLDFQILLSNTFIQDRVTELSQFDAGLPLC